MREQNHSDINDIAAQEESELLTVNHEIGSYEDGGVKVTMTTQNEDIALPHLYEQATKRLMYGIRSNPDKAIAKLKAANPKKVQAVIDALITNYTPEGIKAFETSFRKGFKKISVWRV